MPIAEGVLPREAQLIELTPHRDDRGHLIELWRASWGIAAPVQWNASRSEPGVLRGVHVHPRHTDYLVAIAGRMVIGIRDLRPGSETTAIVELVADSPEVLIIPPRVAHGFFFPEQTLHCYAVDDEFDPADELGCRFDDPALGIPWPTHDVLLSPRDDALPSLEVLLEQLEPFESALSAAD